MRPGIVLVGLALSACGHDGALGAPQQDASTIVDLQPFPAGEDLATARPDGFCAPLTRGAASCPLCDPIASCSALGCGVCGDPTETCDYTDYGHCWCDESATLYCAQP
jgi:hypothetical protein